MVTKTTASGCKGQTPGMDDPQVELMLRVQRDEPGAFAELLERCGPLVFGRFYRQLNDRSEAEDLGVDFDEHLRFVIDALGARESELMP